MIIDKFVETFSRVGITICDSEGKIRHFLDVIQELSTIWDKLSEDQQNDIAKKIKDYSESDE